MNPSQGHVFVSYSHSDADVVLSEVACIEATGMSVWLDRGITPGASWREEIAEAIEQCSVFLFFVTPQSVTSAHCQRELDYALETDKRVLCVHLAETSLSAGQKMTLMGRQNIYRYQMSDADYTRMLMSGLSASPSVSQPQNRKHSARRTRFGIGGVVLVLVIAVVGWLSWQQASVDVAEVQVGPGEVSSIAVMPFTAIGTDSESTSIGVHAELLSYLARLPGLALISIDSLNRIQEEVSTPEVAEMLDVHYVMRGTLQRVEDRLRLNLTLLHGASGRIAWSETYDQTIEDLFSVQTDIAQSVADHLAIELGADEVAGLNRAPTDNLDAWRLFQEARGKNIQYAIPLLREAISLDPNFGPALAQLALRLSRSNHTDYDEIRGYALRAAEIRPNDAETVAIVGESYAIEDPLLAEKYFKQARALDPLWGSEIVGDLRFWLHADKDGALNEFQRALRLNPLNPQTTHAWALLANREFDATLRHVDSIERVSPGHFVASRIRAFVAEADNNLALAIESASAPQLRKIDNREPLVMFLNAVGLPEQAAAAIRHPEMSRNLNHGIAALLRDTGRLEELQDRLSQADRQYEWMHRLVRQQRLIAGARTGVTAAIRQQLRADIENDDAFMRERYSRYAHIPAWFLRHDLPLEGLIARRLAGMDESLAWLIEAIRYALDHGGTFELPKREHLLLGVAAALEGNVDEAVVQFERAHEYGLRNLAGLTFFGLIDDPNNIFGGLTDDVRYQALLAKIRKANALTRSILEHRAPHLLDVDFLARSSSEAS